MPKKAKGNGAELLRESLIDNLESRGLVEEIYIDKVDEYIDLWKRRQQLKKDIEERGVTVFDEKRGTLTENRSVSLEIQVSRQLLSLYNSLGFKTQADKNTSSWSQEDEL